MIANKILPIMKSRAEAIDRHNSNVEKIFRLSLGRRSNTRKFLRDGSVDITLADDLESYVKYMKSVIDALLQKNSRQPKLIEALLEPKSEAQMIKAFEYLRGLGKNVDKKSFVPEGDIKQAVSEDSPHGSLEKSWYEMLGFMLQDYCEHGALETDEFLKYPGAISLVKLLKKHPEHADTIIFSGLGEVTMMKHLRNHRWNFAKIKNGVFKQMKKDSKIEIGRIDRDHDVVPADLLRYLNKTKGFFHRGFGFNFIETETPNQLRDHVIAGPILNKINRICGPNY